MKTLLDEGRVLIGTKDPFSGEPLKVAKHALGWVGGAISEHGGWLTPMYSRLEDLTHAIETRCPDWAEVARPAKEPVLACPFDGGPLEIWQESLGWVVGGRGWYTLPFWGREHAEWFVSQFEGAAPGFPKERVVLVGERQPDLVAAAQEVLHESHRRGKEVTDAHVDKLATSAGLIIPVPGRRKRV